MSVAGKLKLFYSYLQKIHSIESSIELLHWDQRVVMPPKGAQFRATQIENLEEVLQSVKRDKEFLNVLDALIDETSNLNEDDQLNVSRTKKTIEKEQRVPLEFVLTKSKLTSESYSNWVSARSENDFSRMLPYYTKIFEMAKEEANLIGFEDSPYDPLLDNFEEDLTYAAIRPVFTELAESLKTLLPRITNAKDSSHSLPELTEEEQQKFNYSVLEKVGFDFSRGCLHKTTHPFESKLGTNDIRITTRYNSKVFLSSLLTGLHEAGHGLYEQNLPGKWESTPRGSSLSMAMHESISRLYENLLGRSRSFSLFLSTLFSEVFPNKSVLEASDCWSTLNKIEPSLIRVEADEVTYSLHICIRTELEAEILSGDILVKDLPEAWASKYEHYLGIAPKDFKTGVLQDVHWASGLIGYFPSYALGNLYGAYWIKAIKEQCPDLDSQIQNGNFMGILSWLRENIFDWGQKYTCAHILERVSNESLSPKPFVEYLTRKFA